MDKVTDTFALEHGMCPSILPKTFRIDFVIITIMHSQGFMINITIMQCLKLFISSVIIKFYNYLQ